MTRVTNKHLLDVYDEPMVFFPIRTLHAAGIRELVIVTGQEIDQFKSLLGSGDQLGVDLVYEQQEGEGGIADALACAQPHIEGQRVAVILGDNIYQEDLSSYVEAYRGRPAGAMLLLKRVAVQDARRFGVAEVVADRITHVVEKPQDPKSDLVVTGFYMYDERVLEIIGGLTPSDRGELEITDVNNAYINSGEMTYEILKGWWTDAGTPASKLKASVLVALGKGVTFHA
jgi:glucose-1-phosphate thymidylyltransferase